MTAQAPNNTILLPRRYQRPLEPRPQEGRWTCCAAGGWGRSATDKKTRRQLTSGRHRGRLGDSLWVSRRRRRCCIFRHFASELDEAFRGFEFLIFLTQSFQFQAEDLACGGGDLTAHLGAARAAEIASDGAANIRQGLLDRPFQEAADLLPYR